MKKSIVLFIFLLGFSLLLSCKGDKIQNQWADHGKIAIDGKYADWEGIAQYTLEEQNIVAGLANDDIFLYFMFRGNDEQMARQIQMMGVTIWLNKEGKKQKDYGICYTGSTDIHISRRPEMAESDRRPKEMDERMKQMEERMKKTREKRRENLPNPGRIFVIHDDEKTEQSEISFEGPAAGSAYKDEVFCYEFRMPLPISIETGKEIKLGLELGGMNEEDQNAMRQEMREMRGQGEMPDGGEPPNGDMGGRPGGMGKPGGMGGRSDGRPGGKQPSGGSGMEKQEIWFTILLAEK